MLAYLYAFSDDFIENPIKFKIFINDSPKHTIVPRKLKRASEPFSMSRFNMNIIEVTSSVGIKNMKRSAITIPE